MQEFLKIIGWLANATILFFLVVIVVRMFLETQKKNLAELPGGPLLLEISDLFMIKFMRNLVPVLEGKTLEIGSIILLGIFYLLIRIFLIR